MNCMQETVRITIELCKILKADAYENLFIFLEFVDKKVV